MPARAQEAPQVLIHGAGSWAYGNTSANAYLGGLPEGDYRSSSFALNTLATSGEHLRIAAQAEWHEDEHGGFVGLDYAFAEWRFSDALRLRLGQVKQPFGISTEVFRIGTVRPFLELPQAVYGPVGLTGGKAYKGIGLTGTHVVGTWTLRYDVYVGGIDQEEFVMPELFLLGAPLTHENELELESTRDVLGGRLVLQSPVTGLSVGVSAYGGNEIGSSRRVVVGVQAEYLSDRWSLRTEYAHEDVRNDLEATGLYGEAAYRLGPRWQFATQYGRHTMALVPPTVIHAPSLLEHEELALGVNYWFSPALVVKLSYHHVDGNRLALPEPEELEAQVRAGTLARKTNLIQFGAQFTF